MPYEWIAPLDETGAQSRVQQLHLWPYRSLPKRGFVWFIGGTSALIAVPLIPFLGNPVFWGLLPFLVLTIAGVWLALNRSYQDGAIFEQLTLWPDRIALVRHNPRGPRQEWEANPFWVSVQCYPTEGPVPCYITLKGAGREVEIGAFLSEGERSSLRGQLEHHLALARTTRR